MDARTERSPQPHPPCARPGTDLCARLRTRPRTDLRARPRTDPPHCAPRNQIRNPVDIARSHSTNFVRGSRTPHRVALPSAWYGRAGAPGQRLDRRAGSLSFSALRDPSMGLAELEGNTRAVADSTGTLLREIVAHLSQNRTLLREEWVRRIAEARLLKAMTKDEIFAEATSVYDSYVEALETRTLETLQSYAQNLSERIIPRGVETHEVVGIVLLLRDVLARSLFAKYHKDPAVLARVFDAYEPAANAIAITVSVGFVQERERVIREQQEAIRELSTPVLQVRERLLILPMIGLIDPHRARQLTEQLLRGIRANRARVVVIDITGVAAMDANVANHLVLTVESARLLGARVIVTGLSPEIAQTLVNIGVDLGKMNTVGDLQGGIEEAERVLGYKVVPAQDHKPV